MGGNVGDDDMGQAERPTSAPPALPLLVIPALLCRALVFFIPRRLRGKIKLYLTTLPRIFHTRRVSI